jgi:hypothetical protein
VFVEDTLVPMWRHHDDELTQSLADEFGPGLRVQRDLTRVAALQENADAVYSRALRGWDGGLITRNEARVMMGLPRVEDLQLPRGAPALPSGDTFVDSYDTLPTLPAPIDVTPTDDGKAVPPELAAKALKASSTRRVERRIDRAVREYLASEYSQAAERITEVMDG